MVMTAIELERRLAPAEAGKLVGVHTKTLSVWRQNGSGPKWIKIGPRQNSMIRYRLGDLLDWLDLQTMPLKVTKSRNRRA
ncbi:MAG: hypothetical protein IID32_05800 [Planctomycetes bacterium]|nr:hypothetical protein [Planctomycetota bacterium]